ncbi:hypothetical protein KGF57_001148 [Candida theae]|uniref:Uncharacterized protein n=1 Tax=Candida theae TaxID=1198502 RepID=A0AAD5BHQ3_9ASCO|nr:uncharacterized protein KGF57_001148 [Candida theae]KAI5964037.1 hypothetical protein KGF57_001148 [Candida theae]
MHISLNTRTLGSLITFAFNRNKEQLRQDQQDQQMQEKEQEQGTIMHQYHHLEGSFRKVSTLLNKFQSSFIQEELISPSNNEETHDHSSISTIDTSQSMSSLQIISISSITKLRPQHLSNSNFVYKLRQDKGVIIHTSKLNLPQTHPSPSLHQHSNEKRDISNNWLLVQSPYPPQTNQVHFPISKCLNQQFGDGGSIDVQSTIYASFIHTLDLTLGLNILFASESFTVRLELTKAITWRNLYTCTVPDGMIGQVWARSDVVEFESVRLSFVEFERGESGEDEEDGMEKVFEEEEEEADEGYDGYDGGDDDFEGEILRKRSKLRLGLRHKSRGNKRKSKTKGKLNNKQHRIKLRLWRKLQKVKMFNGGGGGGRNGLQQRPIISCVTDVRLLDCSGKRTRDLQNLEVI